MKKKILQSVAVLTIILVGGFWGAQRVHAEGWETVGDAGNSGGASSGTFSLAINPLTGEPYIAYRDSDWKPAVVKFSEGEWKAVDNESLRNAACCSWTRPFLVFNPATGEPYIAFDDCNGFSVIKLGNNGWEGVGSAIGGGVAFPFLSFNPVTSETYVVYGIKNEYNSNLTDSATVKKFSDGNWQTVGDAGFSSTHIGPPSLAFNSTSGEPYVAYRTYRDFPYDNSDKPTVMKLSNDIWQEVGNSEYVSTTWGIADPSIAVDPSSGEPYVAYADTESGKVKVMKYGDNEWQNLGDSGSAGVLSGSLSFALNPSTKEPYVAFRDTNSAKATVKKFSGGVWQAVGNEGFSKSQILGQVPFAFNSLTNEPYVAVYAGPDSYNKLVVMKYAGDTPPPESKQPALYGLFIGNDKIDNGGFRVLNGKYAAMNLAFEFSKLPNVAKAIPLVGNIDTGGVTKATIKNTISTIYDEMSDLDTLIIYIVGHGGSNEYKDKDESTINPEDEYIEVSSGDAEHAYLTDDDLYSYLTEDTREDREKIKKIHKWIILDACHSGGFWGNGDYRDLGDLEKLSNTALFSAAPEDGYAYIDFRDHVPLFGKALIDGFKLDNSGDFEIDRYPRDGSISFDELSEYLKNWNGLASYINNVVVKQELGDLVTFEKDMWDPSEYKTADFTGGIDASAPQDPDIYPEIYPVADGSGPYTGSEGKQVKFDASKSYDSDGTIEKYEWDWDNDGNYEESSTSPTIERIWNSPLSEGIVGLQVTDNDGLTSTDKILVNISSKTICSSLKKDGRFDFFDTFKLKSGRNEKVTVKLRQDENGEYTNGRATLTLWPGIHQFRKEKGSLPIELNAKLVRSGWYDISVLRQFGKKGFTGDYCITLESSGDAWQTLKATRNVE